MVIKSFVANSILGIAVLVVVPPASALSTWLPDFVANKQVYVDPALERDPSHPVRFSPDFSAKLKKAQEEHNLDIYVVATRQGSENVDPESNLAVAKLDDLIARWVGTALPKDTYLTILWVRRADNPSKGWVAANGGSTLRTKGLTGEAFSGSSGPVIPALRQHMPQNPEGAILAIAENVNETLSEYDRQQEEEAALAKSEAERERQEALEQQRREVEFQQQTAELKRDIKTYGPWGLLGVIVVGGGSWLGVRFQNRRQEALAVLTSWKERLANANALYLKLYDEYFPFLKEQSDWEQSFQGATQERYRLTAENFTEFILRLEAANQRFQAAQAAVNRNVFPLTWGYDRANHLLTSQPIQVTGEELPLEVAQLFKGLVVMTTYKPEQLLTTMSELFDRVNESLAQIVGVIKEMGSRQQAITELQAAIADAEAKLIKQQLPVDPYQSRLEQLCSSWLALQPRIEADPLASQEDCLQLSEQFESLLNDMKRALSLRAELAQTRAEIAAIAERIEQIRTQPVDYRYPLAAEETRPGEIAGAAFALDEPAGNPDPLVAQAWRAWSAAEQFLRAAQLQAAADKQGTARSVADQANQFVEATFAAKAMIETEVATVPEDLRQLSQQIPEAEQALASLQAEFLPLNFVDQPGQLAQAQATLANSPVELAAIKQAYEQQHYQGGQQRLKELQHQLERGFQGLAAIQARLVELQELRYRSRDRVAACQNLVVVLKDQLTQQPWEFTTAAETHRAFASTTTQLQQLVEVVGQSISDWPEAAQEADALHQQLSQIEQEIPSQQQAYAEADFAVKALKDELVITQGIVSDPETRFPAREEWAKAQQRQVELEAALTQAHRSDWSFLVEQAAEGLTWVKRARENASADKRAAEAAREAIAQANAAIQAADRSYGYGVSADLSISHQALGGVSALLSALDYEAAKRQAEQALSEAQKAQAAAAQEARQQQAASSSSSSSSSWGSSSSWSSGGGSFSGDSGGGSFSGGSGGGSY